MYAPVKKVMAQRRAAIDESYSAAEEAREKAEADKSEWAKRLELSKTEADSIIKEAETNAANRENEIISEARERAYNRRPSDRKNGDCNRYNYKPKGSECNMYLCCNRSEKHVCRSAPRRAAACGGNGLYDYSVGIRV